MALQIINTDMVGGGAQIDLTTADDVFVSAGSLIASTGGITSTLIGLGNNHAADIHGTIVGRGIVATLGDSGTTDYQQRFYVGAEGLVRSYESQGVALYGYQSVLENDGRIEGSSGVYFNANNATGSSSIINSGQIIGHGNDAIRRAGTEDFTLNNSGLIDGAAYGLHAGVNWGDVRIYNSGAIRGLVLTSTGDDVYNGRAGTCRDVVYTAAGDDRLFGGSAREQFGGGDGADRLSGGRGADDFLYFQISESTRGAGGRDLITDFSRAQNDEIDLAAIDAIPATGPNNSFTFIGADAFSGRAGELRYRFVGDNTLILADTDGDGAAEMAIELVGNIRLWGNDFAL